MISRGNDQVSVVLVQGGWGYYRGCDLMGFKFKAYDYTLCE